MRAGGQGRLDWYGCLEHDDPPVWNSSPLSLQSAAAHCGGAAGRVSHSGIVAHKPPDAHRSRLPICALRTRDVGAAIAAGWLLYHLRQHSRWSSRLPARRAAAYRRSAGRARTGSLPQARGPGGASGASRRVEQLGTAPPAYAHSVSVAAAVSCGRMPAWAAACGG